jgi:hypothetical protein
MGCFPLKTPEFLVFFTLFDICRLRPTSVNFNLLSGHQKAPAIYRICCAFKILHPGIYHQLPK